MCDRRMADLQREMDELRQRLRTPQSSEGLHDSPIAMLTAAAELGNDSVRAEEPAGLQTPLAAAAAPTPYLRPPLPPRQLLASRDTPRGQYLPNPMTSSRMLNGVVVTAEEVNELFQM